MSGLEVIGGISAVIGIIDASIKIYDSARKDLKLSEAFTAVGRQLPIILDTLRTCKNHLDQIHHSLPADVCEALEKILDSCDRKAGKLREVFEKVIPGENDTREQRYLKLLKRYGKGNKIEELMGSITQDVQLVVNHHAVQSTSPERNAELETIIQEMKSVKSSVPGEESMGSTFDSGGGAQTNNLNYGGTQTNNNAPIQTQNNYSVTKPKDDFSFREPAGVHLSQAPYIDPGLFIGRESDVKKIETILSPSDESQEHRRVVLGGKGGIGKTQLAIAYANHYRRHYQSIFWLNAASEVALKTSFGLIAQQVFDLQESRVLQSEEAVIKVNRWLSNRKNTEWLLIFDNYDDPSQFDLTQYCPAASHGKIIVTTRRPDLVAGTEVRIKPLEHIEESLEILETRSQRKDVKTNRHARRLAQRLGGLPLALATTGAYLRLTPFTFERYLQEYEKRWIIDPRRPFQLQEYQDRTLYTTWDLSYTRLESDDPDAARLLKLLAYFDNQSIWYGLLNAGLTDDSPEWFREVIVDDVSFASVMRTLTDYCFVEVQLATGDEATGSWSMHNCVHDWTLDGLNSDVDADQYWLAFDCIANQLSGEDWVHLSAIRYQRFTGHACRLLHDRFRKAANQEAPTRLGQLVYLAQLLQEQVQLDAAEQMYRRALAWHEKALGLEHTWTLFTVNNLGILYADQGKLAQAEEMYQRALARKEKALGLEHTSTLFTVNNLGSLYADQGKLAQAEEMYQRALAGYEKALGLEHTSTLSTVNNLGLLYADQGKLAQAEEMYQRALARKEKALGLEHTSTLDTVNNLGSLYADQGKLAQAEEMYQRALAGKEKALGLEHTSTLSTVNNLGLLYADQGKLAQAEEMYQRALAGKEKALGLEHTSTLSTVNNLGLLYADQGKLAQAEEMYQRALAGYEKALGLEHTSTLSTVNNLGLLYADQGKLAQAEEMYQRALAGYEKALRFETLPALNTYRNLGLLYRHQNKTKEAKEMLQRAASGREKVLGADHPDTVEVVLALSNLLLGQEKANSEDSNHGS